MTIAPGFSMPASANAHIGGAVNTVESLTSA